MVDPELLARVLERLREETDELRGIAQLPRDEVLLDGRLLRAVKYGLIVAIEACIDAGQHIIASEKLRAPDSFADVFSVLAEGDYLSVEAVPTLQEMARFRNLLVHVYMDVDDSRVVDVLQSRLGDLDAFRAEVSRATLD